MRRTTAKRPKWVVVYHETVRNVRWMTPKCSNSAVSHKTDRTVRRTISKCVVFPDKTVTNMRQRTPKCSNRRLFPIKRTEFCTERSPNASSAQNSQKCAPDGCQMLESTVISHKTDRIVRRTTAKCSNLFDKRTEMCAGRPPSVPSLPENNATVTDFPNIRKGCQTFVGMSCLIY